MNIFSNYKAKAEKLYEQKIKEEIDGKSQYDVFRSAKMKVLLPHHMALVALLGVVLTSFAMMILINVEEMGFFTIVIDLILVAYALFVMKIDNVIENPYEKPESNKTGTMGV